MSGVKVCETAENGFSYFAEHINSDRSEGSRDVVEGSALVSATVVELCMADMSHPTSIYSIHITTSPDSFWKAP